MGKTYEEMEEAKTPPKPPSKGCEHNIQPWWDCEKCQKSSHYGWHWGHK